MPTMRQTGINTQTHQKLSGTKRSSSSFIPIRTPSALLARDPYQLSTSLQVSLPSIQQLRSTVAECIVLDPFVGHGGRAAEIIDGVTKTFCCTTRDSENNDHEEQQQQQQQQQQQLRPPPITVGAITALDLYATTLLNKKRFYHSSLKNKEYISTGSAQLDQLLLPDMDYCSFEEGCDLSSSSSSTFHIPNYLNDQNNNNFNHCHPSSSSRGGIPYGQITELSGPISSGKTQLALTITAHALLVNKLQVNYLIAAGGGGSSRIAISRRLFAVCCGVARSQLLLERSGNNNDNSVSIDKEAKSVALKCLERVTIAVVPDAYSLLGSLVQIENNETSSTKNNNKKNDDNNQGTLVVIDSISGCLGHHIYTDRKLGASLSNQVSMTLRQMTRSFDGHFDGSSTGTAAATAASSTGEDVLCRKNPPRRFAVVVINGTVGKSANDNNSDVTNSGTKLSSPTLVSSAYKPAMGRYWHGGDMGLWLEEDNVGYTFSGDNSNSALSFYDGNVAGLSRSSDKVVTATLQWHYGKSLAVVDNSSSRGEQSDSRWQAKFVIQAGGVADV